MLTLNVRGLPRSMTEIGVTDLFSKFGRVHKLKVAIDPFKNECRGFAELGTRGLRAEQVIRAADDKEQITLDGQIEATQDLEAALEDVEAALDRAVDEINDQEQRLEKLEAQTIS